MEGRGRLPACAPLPAGGQQLWPSAVTAQAPHPNGVASCAPSGRAAQRTTRAPHHPVALTTQSPLASVVHVGPLVTRCVKPGGDVRGQIVCPGAPPQPLDGQGHAAAALNNARPLTEYTCRLPDATPCVAPSPTHLLIRGAVVVTGIGQPEKRHLRAPHRRRRRAAHVRHPHVQRGVQLRGRVLQVCLRHVHAVGIIPVGRGQLCLSHQL